MFTYRYRELAVALEKKGEVRLALAKTLRVNPEEIFNLEVERFSLDSRRKGDLHWSYNVVFDLKRKVRATGNNARGLIESKREIKSLDAEPLKDTVAMASHVDVIGAGPSGLWAALHLLRKGFSVDIYEQGKQVEERFRDIRKFFVDRKFNAYSNVLFGEGGAGAFSDGKLNTRSRNLFSETVLKDMVDFGVDESVVTFAKPHIGTDKLVLMLRQIRAEIVRLGGHIHFNTSLEDIEIKDGRICAIKLREIPACAGMTSAGAGIAESHWQPCEALVLAVGHSARSVYEMLHARGVTLESKAFAMGVRVEHPQSLINMRQLGLNVDTRLTGAAEYFLATPTINKTSSAYSFCMCPGGVLVPCASEPGTLATNGMSYSHRNGAFANGAIAVPITAGAEGFDIPSSGSLFGGLDLQRKIETDAYNVGGKVYAAPAQTIKNFLAHREDKTLPKTTYPCGLVPSNLWDWMDKTICQSLAEGFQNFDRKIPGFINEGLIVAPETRTSSPLRITRNNETLESVNTQGLFVLGEGAGYAGGIVTSAADGVRLAHYAKKCK
ncbi:NAD(P)/FAD-dependent oxidoreductase [Fibrobacter sp. UWB3]|uniref:NAD(P)/FAD-dependent oxidoreductase n=1 Tax=Fibrobacter sp. UWB3 TaxID=1964357 RepID=UPI000B52659F|nr:NAD(P)-binding protein [Fibrobacter sp. UWB3]OWV19469.1 FAD-dependent oxidoreductase [Fibrobacter sp. UWB3]